MKRNIFFIKKIKKFLYIKNFLNLKNFYILSISGGQDSISLLFFFYILKKQLKIKLHILYCNHLWQYDGFYYAIELRTICFLLKITFSQSLPSFFLYNEKKARFWRLKIFYRFSFFFKNSFVVTGHSLTDRIETFFLNLTRGAGFIGLKSFNEKKQLYNKKKTFFFSSNNCFFFKKKKKEFKLLKKEIRLKKTIYFNKSFLLELISIKKLYLLRPLFLLTRNEIKVFLKISKVPIFPDKTNYDYFYKRNRIRKQIFPLLKVFLNRQIHLSFFKIIETISFNENIFIKEIDIFYKNILLMNNNFFCINLELFKKLSSEKQKRLIFLILKKKKTEIVNFLLINKFIWILKSFNKKDKKLMSSKIYIFPKIGFFGKYYNYIYIINN